MRFELTKEFLAELRQKIVAQDRLWIQEQVLELHYAEVAEILDKLTNDEAKFIYFMVDEDTQADILMELEEEVRDRFLASLSSKEMADQLENLDSDDAADILGDLPDEKIQEVISQMEDDEAAEDIVDLLNYDDDTAGGLMQKEFFQANVEWPVNRAIIELRKQAEDVEKVYNIFVVDDDDHLLGVLSLKRLLFANARTKIENIYQSKKIISVKASDSAEVVAKVMEKYDLVSVPVVDYQNKLVGRITLDDVVDYIKEEADKDYQLASGISEDVESGDSIWTLTRARLPWLLIGMGGGMSSAYIIGLYDITENPQMAIFMPLIAATGGNVGVQSAALVVKALANQSVLDETVWRKLLKELGVGSFNGLICSLLIFFTTQLFHFDLSMSITASLALFSVIVFASISGTYIPLTLNRFGIDPALATGPFITTTNDIIGLIIYFGVGKMLHTYLLTMPFNIFH